jgi:tetratricopeptide (TPR) repeat protein
MAGDEPTDAAGWVARGAGHGKAHELEKALACFEKAIKFDPQHASAWVSKAAALSQLGRHPDALKAFEQVKKVAPENMQAVTRRFQATSLQAVGRSAEALPLATAAVTSNPNDSQAWMAKAEAEFKLKNRAEARKSLRKLMLLIDAKHALFNRARELQDELELGEAD